MARRSKANKDAEKLQCLQAPREPLWFKALKLQWHVGQRAGMAHTKADLFELFEKPTPESSLFGLIKRAVSKRFYLFKFSRKLLIILIINIFLSLSLSLSLSLLHASENGAVSWPGFFCKLSNKLFRYHISITCTLPLL